MGMGGAIHFLIIAVAALLPVAVLFYWGVEFANEERRRDENLRFQMRTDHEVSP